ncbi:ROK family transcriptional regulator [Secundilactobacillus collinoides]|uniref:ROK family protein n=1 Tax=Secundilactobacillus collinoides DSM 20515 = JCM 1123 TaxID=1423733 RepID=A0A0R2BB80_SECCO|nr:ROK family transcriptional regulator [Secundilactobacillus collinoides]KRM73819.1 ROK family protein [Secundilactobacillus collinoides DSM 20515 = JCM 1123]
MIINKNVMRDHNQKSVLQAIINYGPISRNEISHKLGLNRVTVSKIIGSFVEKKIVLSIGESQSIKNSGRKPEMVAYHAIFGFVVSFSISSQLLEMLVTTMDGRVLHYDAKTINNLSVKKISQMMQNNIDHLPNFGTVEGLQAISIGMFGNVYQNKVVFSPFIDFGNFDIRQFFETQYHVPVVIENKANLSAIFEQDFSQQELENIVSLMINEGVGAGVIINRQLFTGNYGQAGEIGRLIIPTQKNERRNLSELPNLDSEWSENAIVEKGKAATKSTHYSMTELVSDYDDHNEGIRDLVEQFCYRLAVLTNDLVAEYDPQMIFFNAAIIDQIPEILKNVQMKLSDVKILPPLVMSKDVKYATLLGGASLAIRTMLHMEETRLIFHR